MPFSPDYADFLRMKRIQTEVAVNRTLDARKTRAGAPNAGYNPSYQLQNLPPNIFTPGRLIPQPTPPSDYTDGKFVFSDPEKTILIGYNDDVTVVTSLDIPSTTVTISANVFSGCSSLTSLTLPSGLTTIETGAFSGCSSLTSITIPDSVINIGSLAFFDCPSLITLTLGTSLQYIGPSAFGNCSSLVTLTIPGNVSYIGQLAFNTCNSLSALILHEGLEYIGTSAFSRCSSLANLTIPDSVTTIGISAFSNCRSLESLTIGSGLTSIYNDVFSYCVNLSSLIIPSGITSIGTNAFSNCNSLAALEIGSGVASSSSIGDNAFYGCDLLDKQNLTISSFNLTFTETFRIFTKFLSNDTYTTIDFENTDSVTSVSLPTSQTVISLQFINLAYSGINSIRFSLSGYDFTGSTCIVATPNYTPITSPVVIDDQAIFRVTPDELPLYSTWYVQLTVANGYISGFDTIGFSIL